MSAPRHLWSGDWRSESSAHAEDLAARRENRDEPSEPAAPPPRPSTSWRAAARAWLALAYTRLVGASRALFKRLPSLRSRRLAAVSLIVFVTLLSAGAAYAVTSLVVKAVNGSSTAAGTPQPWLGIDVSGSPPRGAVVVAVLPGSPVRAAGIRRGDLITQIGGQPITGASDVPSAIAGRHPGDWVTIDFQRGSMTYTTQVALASRPAG